METIIENEDHSLELNKVMEEFNESYTNASTDKKREAVEKKFEKKIASAEKDLEAKFDKMFQDDLNELKEQENAFNEQLKKEAEEHQSKLESPVLDFSNMSVSKIVKTYSVKKVRGYAKHLNLDPKGSEKIVVERILSFLAE